VRFGANPEAKCPDRPCREGEQNGEGYLRDVGIKFLRDIGEHEYHQKEVEGVERPAEEACSDDVLLLTGPTGQSCNLHEEPP
jgi:hypothetical protein